MSKLRKAIGLMSGTSMDGIDVALIETDGADAVRRGPTTTYAYDQPFRATLATAIEQARHLTDRHDRPSGLAAIERNLTDRHAQAVLSFLADKIVDPSDIDIVGFHGQTVLHDPDHQLTIQIGDGAALCEAIGLPVAWDLRADDVAAGGQGAPLAPAYHRAMTAHIAERPIAVLNIGGVANVTWIGPGEDDLIAFDTGPGNALLDDWMAKSIGAARDEGGAAALAGNAQSNVVDFFLGHAYFAAPPPKSLDRNSFFWDLVDGLSVADGAATLVAMTVGAIARAEQHMPAPPRTWVVCGGGRNNQAILAGLRESLAGSVIAAEDVGIDGDAVEAEAWAYLAVRALDRAALTYPGTTGVPRPMPGGRLSWPASRAATA